MNPIYYDGTKYYKVGKHKDGSYVKFEVDNVGTYKCGGKVHKYGGHLDMNMDVSKMYQVGGIVKAQTGVTIPGTQGQTINLDDEWYVNPGDYSSKIGTYNYNNKMIDPNYRVPTMSIPKTALSDAEQYNTKLSGRPYIEADFKIEPHGKDSEVYITPDGKVNEFQIMPNSGTEPVTNWKDNPNTNVNSSSLGTSNHQDFNPRKLTTYGDKIALASGRMVDAYNFARSLEPAYKNPLIMPEFKFKKQFAQADFNPVYEMQNVGMRNMANNARSTAALMGNLQQLNAKMVKSKSDIARQAQAQQRGYDATYNAQQQAYENQLAVARQNVENLNKGDEAEKYNQTSDAFTVRDKNAKNEQKLYNANLQNWNKMNTYVNQLSPEYQAVRDKEGVVKIVFKSSGKEVPAEHFAKAQAEYNARVKAGQAGTTTNTTSTAKTFKIGGKVTTTNTPNKIKKLRTGLY